jgi:hypothetical protein
MIAFMKNAAIMGGALYIIADADAPTEKPHRA